MYREGLNFSQLKELKKLCGIYRLSVAEHSYIGSSKNLYARLHEHMVDLYNKKHTNPFLQKVVNKYGLEAIVIDIIELCDAKERVFREKYWITTLSSDMNLKDPVTCELSEESKKKVSESLKKGYEIGRHTRRFQSATIDCYDYFGEYITTYSTKEEAAASCNISVKDVTECLRGYRKNSVHTGLPKGKAINGYRFRYSCSTVPPLKFSIHPRMVGSYFTFYYEDEFGNRSVAFTNLKDCWEFIAEHCRDKKITIIPVLKSRESWELRQKSEDHNGSSLETGRTIRD